MFENNNILDEDLALDLTPLIDVIFMLLIFFIMTTTFSKPVVDIILPSAEHTEEAVKQEELVISLTAEGGYFYKDNQMSIDDLDKLFKENPEAIVNFHIDQKAPFDAFVRVIDKVKEKEGANFVISTEAN